MKPRRSRRAASRIQSTARRLISARQPGSSVDAERDRGTSASAGVDGGPSTQPQSRRRRSVGRDVDVDLAQAVLAHHDLVHRQRVEQLVGDQHAFERRPAASVADEASRSATSPSVAALRARAPRRWLRRDAAAMRVVEVGMARASRRAGCRPPAGRCRRRLRRGRIWNLESGIRECAAISAICTSSSSPNSGPTSTLVKKSPARPERWAARA